MEATNNNAAQAAEEVKFEPVNEQPMEETNSGGNWISTIGTVARGLWQKKLVRDGVKVGGGALLGWIGRGLVSKKNKD